MMQKISAAVLTLVLTGIVTPASAASREQQQMMADLRMLQEQSMRLQLLLGTLTEALKTVNARLDQQAEAERRALADQKLSIDTLSNDLRVVREKVDDGNVRIGSISQEVDALRQAVVRMSIPPPPPPVVTTDGAPAAGDPNAATAAATDPPAAAPVAVADPLLAPPPVPLAAGASPRRLWDAAMADYGAANYDLAALGFESYAKSFPTAPDADDALVYVAQSYLNGGDDQKAVETADYVIRAYPSGDALPTAYLRKAQALSNLQETVRAREAFEHIVKTYPDTPEATIASQGLLKLNGQP